MTIPAAEKRISKMIEGLSHDGCIVVLTQPDANSRVYHIATGYDGRKYGALFFMDITKGNLAKLESEIRHELRIKKKFSLSV